MNDVNYYLQRFSDLEAKVEKLSITNQESWDMAGDICKRLGGLVREIRQDRDPKARKGSTDIAVELIRRDRQLRQIIDSARALDKRLKSQMEKFP